MKIATQAFPAQVYIEGHNVKRGYAISRTWSQAELSAAIESGDVDSGEPYWQIEPLRYISNRARALRLVDRYNRRGFSHALAA